MMRILSHYWDTADSFSPENQNTATGLEARQVEGRSWNSFIGRPPNLPRILKINNLTITDSNTMRKALMRLEKGPHQSSPEQIIPLMTNK
jgi:hypothetical protein